MRQSVHITAWGGRLTTLLYALAAVACALVVYAATVRNSAPVVETVTTVARPAPPEPTPYVNDTVALPPRDADVEQAGDRIAEAEVYLRKRQSDRALAALGRARRAAARALEVRQRKGTRGDELTATLRELDSVERAIQRGAYEDAHRQLVALNKNLDRINY